MAFDLEQLPPAVLQSLAVDVPRAFLKQLVRCAADDLSAYGVVSALLVQFARKNPRGASAQHSAGSIHEPLYFVQLKLQTPGGGVESLVFTCSVDELRDIVYRLQEAANELEKLASGVFPTTSVDP
ncbi:hypothetical protein PybrP1_007598 [[Pythium] brassicae (nom. inval.)]|nr:hypothetical protein PybrP1_007598 [[Pythium] brassicae (nom. inval.)]